MSFQMYAIVEEETSRGNHRCDDCTFVNGKEDILLYFVTREAKAKPNSKPTFCGKFTMHRWVGHSAFYFFTCQDCHTLIVDYPHGYRGEFVYLRCDKCRFEIILDPRKYGEIYDRDAIFKPKVLLRKEKREEKTKLKKELERIEAMGIVPIVGAEIVQPQTTLKDRILYFLKLKS